MTDTEQKPGPHGGPPPDTDPASPEFRQGVLRRYRRHVNVGLARLASLMDTHVEVRSGGNYVYDERGERYLDCGGYGVFILGHCHPDVIAAVSEQLGRHPLSSRALINHEMSLAAEALAAVTPGGLDYVYFGSTGAEAVDVGIKLACLSGKHRLIAMRGGFHGKTIGALSVTGRERYRAAFGPLLLKAEFVRFGDADELSAALSRDGGSCVILEPVQAEGGVIIPPAGYLKEVERLCRHHGAFLILDEIQTGLGRLGAWWGAEREGVIPDVLLAGKSLGGGVIPVSAAVTSQTAYRKLNEDPLLHTSTFSGNPLAAAAAAASLKVIRRDGVVSLARQLGQKLLETVRRLSDPHRPHLIREVRGQGLLIGIEFEKEFLAGDFLLELIKHRVIVSYSLNADRVLRLTPPAFLSESDVGWLADAFRESAAVVSERYATSADKEKNTDAQHGS